MNIRCFGPLSEDVICKLESALGVTLPGNYREFLEETGGGVVKQDGSNKVLIPANNQTFSTMHLICAKPLNFKRSLSFI